MCSNVFNEEGKTQKKFKHPAAVFGVHWHTSNKHILATGCHDFAIRVFNITNANDTPISVLKGHTAEAFNVVWHPTIPNILASGSNDKTVRVWNTDTGACKVLRGHTHYVRALAWNHELSHIILSGSWDGTVRVWDAKNEKQIAVTNDHHADVYGLCSHPERPFIFGSTSRDTTIRFWDLDSLVRSYYIKAIYEQSLNSITGQPIDPLGTETAEPLLSGPGSKIVQARITAAKSDVEKYTLLSEYFNFPHTSRNLWELVNSFTQGKKFKSSMKSDVLFCNSITDTVYNKAKEIESARYKNKGANAILRVAEQLKEAAKLYLKIGKVKSYCEIMCEVGEWDKAIALAPAVSMDYWKDLTARYAKSLVESESEDVVPYYIAIGDVDKLLNFYIRKCQYTDASIVARRSSESGYPKNIPPSALPAEQEENHDNVAITTEMRRIAEMQAKAYMKESKPILAASAFLSIKDIDKCMHYLIKGCEGVLAFAMFKALSLREDNHDNVLLAFSALAIQCGQLDYATNILSKVKNREEVSKLMSLIVEPNPVERERLFINAGLQSLNFYSTNSPTIEETDTAQSIRFYAFNFDYANAAVLAIMQYETLFSTSLETWDWNRIAEIHSAVQCLDVSKLQPTMKSKIMYYSFLIGTQLALWKEYYSIAPKMIQNARECIKQIPAESPVPSQFTEYLYCLSVSYANPDEGLNLLTQVLSNTEYPLEEAYAKPLIAIKKRLEDKTFVSDVSSNLVVPSGSNLPVRSIDGKMSISIVSRREAQPPVLLEDGVSIISLAEKIMWKDVCSFSPTMSGSRFH